MKSKLLNKARQQGREDELRQSFVASHYYRQTLTQYLTEQVDTLQKTMRDEPYDTSNWALSQADKIAQTKALLRVIGLLNEEINEKV